MAEERIEDVITEMKRVGLPRTRYGGRLFAGWIVRLTAALEREREIVAMKAMERSATFWSEDRAALLKVAEWLEAWRGTEDSDHAEKCGCALCESISELRRIVGAK